MDNPASSSVLRDHTQILPSRPCLWTVSRRDSFGLLLEQVSFANAASHVIIFLSPHVVAPKTVVSCAFQTATGRLVTIAHKTAQPSASPERRRVLLRMKSSVCMGEG